MKEKSPYIIYIDASKRNLRSVSLLRKRILSFLKPKVISIKKENITIDMNSTNVSNNSIKPSLNVKSDTLSFDIVSCIKDLLKENNLRLEDISEFRSNLGPGSFTGLKVGVTISNVLNWSMNLRNLNSLDVPRYGREPNITPPKKFSL